MQNWYVYYKLPRDRIPDVVEQVRVMLQTVATNTSVHGRLLRRVDDDVHNITLMEQYEHIADPTAFAAALAAATLCAGLPAELIAQRRVERFEEL